ncbi:unnamed protein product [Linum trigynum]|uniref:Uncharacterized protein n=1 Tax=Linum trigynum TaxID=586398 RepID=A0AAV2ER96_9ROSI
MRDREGVDASGMVKIPCGAGCEVESLEPEMISLLQSTVESLLQPYMAAGVGEQWLTGGMGDGVRQHCEEEARWDLGAFHGELDQTIGFLALNTKDCVGPHS